MIKWFLRKKLSFIEQLLEIHREAWFESLLEGDSDKVKQAQDRMIVWTETLADFKEKHEL